uniref:(northern house mosquito) hypothetical protein n=1 Tax=Culex pipiens TaxID=7175 RepID=A0A8D8BFX6_CULPI
MDHWSWMERSTDVQTVDIWGWAGHRRPVPTCPAIDRSSSSWSSSSTVGRGWSDCWVRWTSAWRRSRGSPRLACRVALIVFGFCSGPRSAKSHAAGHRRSRCPCGRGCTVDSG